MHKHLIYRVKKIWHFIKTLLFAAIPANLYFGFPSRKLRVIMITGTDGKTTSASLTYHVLKSAGQKVALISTVAAYIGDQEIDTGFHVTTPTPWQLQKLIKKIVDQECEYLVLETTSQGIYQYRTWGIAPEIAAVTNITPEHLDYHLSYQNYLSAKISKVQQAKYAILNQDDQSFSAATTLLKQSNCQIVSYSTNQPLPNSIQSAVNLRFPEAYNQSNSRLVYKIAQLLDINHQEFAKAIKTFPDIPGRMQQIENNRGLKIVVDFAHTPAALEHALLALKKQCPANGRLIAVYGCAGLRDYLKRPQMGKIGVDLADQVVFTAEDPRTEDVWSIIRQMKEQLTEGHAKLHTIPDRYQAIAFAINKLAKQGDVIGIFGKGHEQSMCYGKTEYNWNDVKVVKEILRQ